MTREEAIEYVKYAFEVWESESRVPYDDLDEERKACDMAIEALSEPKTGKWVPVTRVYTTTENDFPYTRCEYVDATEPDEIDAVRCSECGEVFDFYDARNWCTQCGAYMRGDKHE